jgi:hypothetical protein
MSFGMQSGADYQAAIGGVTNMATAIFGSVASNKSVRDLSINYDDVVVESTHVDSQQLVIGIAVLVLFTYSIYLVVK